MQDVPHFKKKAHTVTKHEFAQLLARVEALEEATKPKRGRPPKEEKQDGDNDTHAS